MKHFFYALAILASLSAQATPRPFGPDDVLPIQDFQKGLSLRLPDGRILVLGGGETPPPCETKCLIRPLPGLDRQTLLFDPALRKWTKGATPNGVYAPSYRPIEATFTLTLLRDGKVLAIGPKLVEVYDPQADQWQKRNSPRERRYAHTATLLRDGRVLITGGQCDSADGKDCPLKSAEIFDPTKNAWKSAAPLSTPREQHSAALLPDGRVLVMGGYTSVAQEERGEIYDPATNSWALWQNDRLQKFGRRPFLMALPEQKVLAAAKEETKGYALMYDLTKNESPVPVAEYESQNHAFVDLGGGKVLFASTKYEGHHYYSFYVFLLEYQNGEMKSADRGGRYGPDDVNSSVVFPLAENKILLLGNLPTQSFDFSTHQLENMQLPEEHYLSFQNFHSLYQDAHGKSWSQLLDHGHPNAAQLDAYCAELSARRPDLRDYDALLREFDHESDVLNLPGGSLATVKLTAAGLARFRQVFPDFGSKYANGLLLLAQQADHGGTKNVVFDGNTGKIDVRPEDSYNSLFDVRCVRD